VVLTLLIAFHSFSQSFFGICLTGDTNLFQMSVCN